MLNQICLKLIKSVAITDLTMRMEKLTNWLAQVAAQPVQPKIATLGHEGHCHAHFQ
jgi:hypothetical protein